MPLLSPTCVIGVFLDLILQMMSELERRISGGQCVKAIQYPFINVCFTQMSACLHVSQVKFACKAGHGVWMEFLPAAKLCNPT